LGAPECYVESAPQVLAFSAISLEKLCIVFHHEPPRRPSGSPPFLFKEAHHGTRHHFQPRVSARTARSRCPAGHAKVGLQPQVLAALSRCLAQLPQLRSLLPDCRDLLGFVGHAVPRHPRHSHRRCTPGTMRCRTRHLTRFLHFLESHQTSELSAIQATHISDFLRSQVHLRPKTVAVIVSDLRSLLRFLCMQGILSDDLSVHVPQVRVARDGRLPSVWSGADVEALLAAVDRASPKGKRDYAILLLACRLGLRVSDIRGLCLENLHWREDRIEMTQTKTGAPLTLPLTEEVGGALIDYLQHGRPVTYHREVFLRLKAPVEPFSS